MIRNFLVLIKDSPLVARFFQTGVRRGKKTLTWSNEKKKKFVVQREGVNGRVAFMDILVGDIIDI